MECWGGTLIEDDMSPEEKAIMEAMWAPPEGRFISVSAGVLVLLWGEERQQRGVLGSCGCSLGRADPAGGEIPIS